MCRKRRRCSESRNRQVGRVQHRLLERRSKQSVLRFGHQHDIRWLWRGEHHQRPVREGQASARKVAPTKSSIHCWQTHPSMGLFFILQYFGAPQIKTCLCGDVFLFIFQVGWLYGMHGRGITKFDFLVFLYYNPP